MLVYVYVLHLCVCVCVTNMSFVTLCTSHAGRGGGVCAGANNHDVLLCIHICIYYVSVYAYLKSQRKEALGYTYVYIYIYMDTYVDVCFWRPGGVSDLA